MSDSIALAIRPIVRYPCVAQVGKTYLMTIDLEVEDGAEWQYEEEEYPIYCEVDSELFKTQIVGEPVIVLHRFGGSYGEAKFLLTAAAEVREGNVKVALTNAWGVPIKTINLERVQLLLKEVTHTVVDIKRGITVRDPLRTASEEPIAKSVEIQEETETAEVTVGMVLVVTSLRVEYLAVSAYLQGLREEVHGQGTIYARGTFSTNHKDWEVGIVEIGAGNVGAALEVEQAIAHFNPDVILFVGVAGGLQNVAIGDVVISSKVYGYEPDRPEIVFKSRPEIWRPTHRLHQLARSVAKNRTWVKHLSAKPEIFHQAYLASIVAGKKIIASKQAEVFQILRSHYEDAVVVEIEEFRFLATLRLNQGVEAIVIRGVSDLLEETITDQASSQEIAARHASAFAFEMLTKLDKTPSIFVLPKVGISSFTGREAEIKQLEDQLLKRNSEGSCRVVGLSGGAGMGKSALAFHFATLHRGKFPDGVMGLPVDGKATHEVARDFARRCGKAVDEDDDRSASTIMQEVFAHRQMLLIFDNANQAILKELHPGGDRCALIVTTRDRQIPSSFGIINDGIIDLPPMPQKDARDLLRKILGIDRVDMELEATDQIIDITGGLPLALQIAGSALRGRQRSLANYVESLRDEKTRVQRLQIRGDEDLNVSASLNLSLNLLEDSEKNLFACLSVCAKDGFSLRTAMVAGGLADEWEARDLLDRLYQLSLLNEVSADRYVFPALVQVYAQEKAQDRMVWEEATRRHAEYFLDLVRSNNVESPEIAAYLTEDFDDVLQAAQWLRMNATSNELKVSGYQFALDLLPFFLKYGYSKRTIELISVFQEWAESLEDWNASVEFKIQHAKYLALDGDLLGAEATLRNAQDSIDRISNQIQCQEIQARQLNSLGEVLQQQGRLEESIVSFERQIQIAETLNDQQSLSIGLNRLGGVFQQQGRLEEAIVTFERQIKIAEALNERKQVAIGWSCLGEVLRRRGYLEKSIFTFLQAATYHDFLGENRQLHNVWNRLGSILKDKTSFEAAIAALQHFNPIIKDFQDSLHQAIALHTLGKAYSLINKLEEAELILNESREKFYALRNHKQLLNVLKTLSGVFEIKQDWEKAEQVIRESFNEAHRLQDIATQEKILRKLGEIYLKQGSEEKFILAKSCFKHSIKLSQEMNNPIRLAQAHRLLGKTLLHHGRVEAALIEISQAFETEARLSNLHGLQSTLSILINILTRLRRDSELLEYFDRAIVVTNNHSALIEQRKAFLGPTPPNLRNRLSDL